MLEWDWKRHNSSSKESKEALSPQKCTEVIVLASILRVWNKHTPTFIIIFFSRGYGLITDLKDIYYLHISWHILRGYVYCFCQIFQRLRLFKGLRLFRTLEY